MWGRVRDAPSDGEHDFRTGKLPKTQSNGIFIICKTVPILFWKQNFDKQINTILILMYMILSLFRGKNNFFF